MQDKIYLDASSKLRITGEETKGPAARRSWIWPISEVFLTAVPTNYARPRNCRRRDRRHRGL